MRAQIVSFNCILRNQIGSIISSTFNRDVITKCEGQSDLLQGLADGMQNLKTGEKRQILLSADRAYGFYDLKLVMECPRDQLVRGSVLQKGEEVVRHLKNGRTQIFRVIETSRNSITLDGNHPLAGLDLIFDIEAIEARDATSEEIAESRESALPAHLH